MSPHSIRNRMGHARLTAANSSFMEAVEAGSLSAQLRDADHADYNRLFMALLFSIFLIALLFAVVVGVHTYSEIAADQTGTNDDRLALSLLANDIRANDAIEAVASGTGPEGPSLVLIERLDSGTYETRFYQYNDHIVQEYTLVGEPYRPTAATTIVKSYNFGFKYSGGLITLTTDEGIAHIAVRSLSGGA